MNDSSLKDVICLDKTDEQVFDFFHDATFNSINLCENRIKAIEGVKAAIVATEELHNDGEMRRAKNNTI